MLLFKDQKKSICCCYSFKDIIIFVFVFARSTLFGSFTMFVFTTEIEGDGDAMTWQNVSTLPYYVHSYQRLAKSLSSFSSLMLKSAEKRLEVNFELRGKFSGNVKHKNTVYELCLLVLRNSYSVRIVRRLFAVLILDLCANWWRFAKV